MAVDVRVLGSLYLLLPLPSPPLLLTQCLIAFLVIAFTHESLALRRRMDASIISCWPVIIHGQDEEYEAVAC